jgi:hypothetical protein
VFLALLLKYYDVAIGFQVHNARVRVRLIGGANKKSSSTAEIIGFMQGKSGQSQKEVCLIIAKQGSLGNRRMVYLHERDPFG